MATTSNYGLTKPSVGSTGWGGDVNTNWDTIDSGMIKNQDNIALTNFRVAVNGSLSKFNLEDGFVDEFEDESGVDTSSSTNESYDATDDYYEPTSTSWDLSSNTVAQYKCNDDAANTTVTDEEGTNGTASTNTSNLSITGKINEAFDFTNASSEYFNCNQAFQTTFRSGFTVACWIKPDDGHPSALRCICGGNNATNADLFNIFLNTNGTLTVYYYSDGNTSSATSSEVFSDGATSWTQIIVTVDSSNIYIYAGNSQVGSGSTSSVTMGDWTSTTNMFVGARNLNGSSEHYFDGGIDDFRVMDKVISQSERDGIYNSGSGTETQSGAGTTQNMTLISNSVEAEAEPTNARILLLMEGTGITVNTDIKAYVSLDDGSNYEQVTLSDEGDYDANKIILAGSEDLTDRSDKTMRVKVETLNNKDIKLHAWSCMWR